MRASTARRRQSILVVLQERGFVRNSELSAKLRVSIVTIREDVESLKKLGLLHKTYGGAILPPDGGSDSAFGARAKQARREKQRIGAAAARLIRRGETFILDAGTTTLEIARRLPENADLTLVTCALNIALVAGPKPGVTVRICGGTLNPRTLSAVGPQVEPSLAEINPDRLFLGTYGVDFTKGLTDRNLENAQTKRYLIRSVREVVLVCDSSKFGEIAPASVAPLDVVHRVITDKAIPPAYLNYFKSRQIPVETV